MEKVLIVIIGLTATLSLSLIVRLILDNDEENSVCLSPECLHAAATLQTSLNLSANPCDDFYSYACGGWRRSNAIPSDRSRWGQYEIVIKKLKDMLKTLIENDFDPKTESPIAEKAKTFYRGCMNTTMRDQRGYEQLKDILRNISWPLIETDWNINANNNHYEWHKVYAFLNRHMGSNFIFSTIVHLDAKNTSMFTIQLNSPSFGLSRETLKNSNTENNRNIISAYKKLIKDSVKLLSNSDKINETGVDNDIELLVNFEIMLAQNTPNNTRDRLGNYGNKTTIKEFMSDYKQIPMLDILQIVFRDVYSGDQQINENEGLVVFSKSYFESLGQILMDTSNRIIANYFGWRLVQQLGSHTTQKVRDIEFEFNKAVTGILEQRPLWEDCVSYTNNVFGYAVGRLYVDKYFSENAKSDINELFDSIKNSFKQMLESNDWMQNETKQKALQKLNAIYKELGYPEFIKSDAMLEIFYEGLDGIDESYHFASILKFSSWIKLKYLLKLRTKLEDKTKYECYIIDSLVIGPAVVNAFYSPGLNRVTFPAGIMQPPFYSYGLPVALNYGGIGAIIGHEIIHGFDDSGSQYDKNGNLNDWWDEKTKQRFREKVRCFMTQYEDYFDSQVGRRIRGSETIGENISDNGGLRQAYKALKHYNGLKQSLPGSMKQFTSEQLFFLSFANVWCSNVRPKKLIHQIENDPHSPHNFRVLGTVSNLDEFAEAFNCKVGDKMHPPSRQKCVLW